MRARVRQGPEPLRQRLDVIEATECAEALRALLHYAQTGEGSYSVQARTLVEAVQVAHDAARARGCIAAGVPVPPRWLAALGGVATSRIRQLLTAGTLRRRGAGVDPISAQSWMASAAAKAERLVRRREDGRRRLVSVMPAWWNRARHSRVLSERVEEIVREMLPEGVEFGFDFRGTPYFEAVGVILDEPEIETLRAEIRGRLERYDPQDLAWTPAEDEPKSAE